MDLDSKTKAITTEASHTLNPRININSAVQKANGVCTASHWLPQWQQGGQIEHKILLGAAVGGNGAFLYLLLAFVQPLPIIPKILYHYVLKNTDFA